MLFKVAICDDEEKDIQAIQRFLHIYEMQHDIDFEINTFQNSTKLLEKYEKSLDKSLKVWYSNKAVREGGGRKRRKRESHGEKDWKNLKKFLTKTWSCGNLIKLSARTACTL